MQEWARLMPAPAPVLQRATDRLVLTEDEPKSAEGLAFWLDKHLQGGWGESSGVKASWCPHKDGSSGPQHSGQYRHVAYVCNPSIPKSEAG